MKLANLFTGRSYGKYHGIAIQVKELNKCRA